MNTAWFLCCALILDAAFGEPKWLWDRLLHPAIVMGRVIGWCDATFNKGENRQIKGALVVLFLILGAIVLGCVLSLLGPIVEILVAAILIAQRSLIQHVVDIANGLRLSLAQGRRAVSMIVSRDTKDMNETSVARSAIESAAENLSDGVIAPAFWFLIAGLPGLLIYKITNTADSMIGYRTPKHEAFGWAAARLDDVLNFIPARLTALLIAIPAGVVRQMPQIMTDARTHKSPNAGWPEAAMARALGVALAGPRSYDGVLRDFDWVNEAGEKTFGAPAIQHAITIMWQAWFMLFAALIVVGFLWS